MPAAHGSFLDGRADFGQAQHRIADNRQQRVERQTDDNGLFAGADDDHDQAEHCQGGNGLEQVSQVEDYLPGLGEEVGDHTQEQSRYNGNADGTEYNGEMFNQEFGSHFAPPFRRLRGVTAICRRSMSLPSTTAIMAAGMAPARIRASLLEETP